jgi:hypothetical protein
MNTLIVNVVISTVIFYLAYRWFLKPELPRLEPTTVLLPLLLLHSMRHLGLMFLTTGVTSPSLPVQFAVPAAAGDFLSATLALIAAVLIKRKSHWAVPMTWLFTVVGLVDFVVAIALSRIYGAGDFLGGAYWIPSFWVPMLLVGHVAIIDVLRLVKHNKLQLQAA